MDAPTNPDKPKPIVVTIIPCDKHWTGRIPRNCPDCKVRS